MVNNMLIALDADGVLVDYNEQMAKVAEKVLQKKLSKIAHAHHFTTAYSVELSREEKNKLYALFAKEGWSSMPAIEGAAKATQKLKSLGYDLVCVTSMPGDFEKQRLENLKNHGMPIDKVIASGRDFKTPHVNPKAQHLEELKPQIFVDDQLRNFIDVPAHICKVWINNRQIDCPSHGFDKSLANFVFHSLQEFAQELEKNPGLFVKSVAKKPGF